MAKKLSNKLEKQQIVNVDSLPPMVGVTFIVDVKHHKKGETVKVDKYIAKTLVERGLAEII